MNQPIVPTPRPTCISLPLPPTPLALPIPVPGSSRYRPPRARVGSSRALTRRYEPGVSFFECDSEESEEEGNMLGLSFSDRETVQGEEGFEFEFDFDGLEGSSLVDEHEDEDDARSYPSSSRSTFRHPYSRTIPSCPSLSQSFDRSSQSSSSSSSASEGETGRFFPMVFDLTSPTVDMGSVKPLSNLNPTALKSHYQTPAIDFLGSRTRSIHPVSPNTFHPYLDTPDRPLANQLHTPKSDLRAGLHPRSTRSSRITLRSALFAARSDGSGLNRGVNCEEGWSRRA